MLKKEEYIKLVSRPYPPFYISVIFEGFSNPEYFQDVIGGPFTYNNIVILDGRWYYPVGEIKLASKVSFDSWTNPKGLENVQKVFSKREKVLIKATNKDLITFAEAYRAYMPALALVFTLENRVEKKVREILPDAEENELMEYINRPLKDNFVLQEQVELVKTKNLKKHAREFEWIKSRYGDCNPYTGEQAQKYLEEIDKTKFLKEYKENKSKIKNAIKRAKKLVGKENEVFIDLMQFIVFYRTQRTDIMNMASYLFIPELKQMAVDKGLTYEELLMCTYTELRSTIPSKEILKERMEGFAFVVEDSKVRLESGKEYKKIFKYFEEKHADVNELKGTIGCKGKVTGIVRVIKCRNDYKDFKDGEILVASMTTLDMVPIMRKAAAFVTDEGGITCHAAIVSREMKKPCVMGTKNATHVLKTGEKVEVDAIKGVVRRI
ncbi:MAG: hypothetical protein KKG59_06600 [Nanoarchaeota archaeon]|nr:hypothetical protein [Nanoarchaeota archaeon]